MFLRGLAALLLLSSLRCLSAQQPSSPPASSPQPTGAISGHVRCDDTHAPARFAAVLPIPIPSKGPDGKVAAPVVHGRSITKTGLEGEYKLDGLAPGDYIVVAELSGYLTPATSLEPGDLEEMDPQTLKVLTDQLGIFHVEPDKTTQAEITLHRGGSIHGMVSYDDGSPVIGALIGVSTWNWDEDHSEKNWDSADSFANLTRILTDSHGKFDVSGIPEGKYLVGALLPVSLPVSNPFAPEAERPYGYDDSSGSALGVFAPGTLHRKTAKPVEITQSEEQQVDITIPLQSLHAIDGIVRVADPLPPIGFGHVMANCSDYPDFHRLANIQRDGSFHFRFMPPCTYQLSAHGLHDTTPFRPTAQAPPFQYPDAQITVILSNADVSNATITVSPAKPSDSAAKPQ